MRSTRTIVHHCTQFRSSCTITIVPECPKFPLNKIPFFLNACNTKCVTHLILLRYSYHIIYNLQYTRVRNPDLDLSQIILIDVANSAPLDLVAATTMVRDKVRTIAHPFICMMMPCFRANLRHRSDSTVLDRLIDLVLGSSPKPSLDGRHAGAVQKWHNRNLASPRCTWLPFAKR